MTKKEATTIWTDKETKRIAWLLIEYRDQGGTLAGLIRKLVMDEWYRLPPEVRGRLEIEQTEPTEQVAADALPGGG